jgi:MFS family permease
LTCLGSLFNGFYLKLSVFYSIKYYNCTLLVCNFNLFAIGSSIKLSYNLFALFFGWLGKRFDGRLTVYRTVVVVLCGALFTVLFTALDNVITPVVFGFNMSAAMAYAYASLAAVIPQTVCTVLTVSVLFVPLTAMLSRIKSADIFK